MELEDLNIINGPNLEDQVQNYFLNENIILYGYRYQECYMIKL